MNKKPEAYRSYAHQQSQLQLITSSTMEEEGSQTPTTYKRRDVLEAVNIIAIFGNANLVVQHEGHFDNARHANSHESVAKSLVRHGADHQLLGVSGHGPAREENDEAWDEVALRGPVSRTAQPYASQAGAPPDYTHGGMLPVVLDPSGAPAMLSKGVDAAPGGNHDRVEEFLGAARAFDPKLTNKQENGQEYAIGDESTAHDEVSQTLADMFALAEAQGGDATKDQLYPDDDGEGFAGDAVDGADIGTDAALDALFEVQPEVDAEDNLGKHIEVDPVAKVGVDVVRAELAAAVHMTECVSDEGQNGSQDLRGDVPSTFYHLSGVEYLSALDLRSFLTRLLLLRCRCRR